MLPTLPNGIFHVRSSERDEKTQMRRDEALIAAPAGCWVLALSLYEVSGNWRWFGLPPSRRKSRSPASQQPAAGLASPQARSGRFNSRKVRNLSSSGRTGPDPTDLTLPWVPGPPSAATDPINSKTPHVQVFVVPPQTSLLKTNTAPTRPSVRRQCRSPIAYQTLNGQPCARRRRRPLGNPHLTSIPIQPYPNLIPYPQSGFVDWGLDPLL